MSNIYYKNGNLLEMLKSNQIQVLIHGCNAFGNMGAGIARQIKIHYPEAFIADSQTKIGSREKIGTYSTAQISNEQYIVNAYTQYQFGYGSDHFEYEKFPHLLQSIVQDERFKGKNIGIPLIGCGLAGGNIQRIIPILVQELRKHDSNVFIVEMNEDIFETNKNFIQKVITE